MQSVSSSIWTRVAVTISYDDNHYTKGTSIYLSIYLSIYVISKSSFDLSIYLYIYVQTKSHTE